MQTNFVSEKAKVHPSVKLGNFITIHDNVEIAADSVVEDYCIIGYPASNSFKGQPLKIGKGSLIRSHSVLYEGSSFGDGLMVGHHCMVREGVVAGIRLQIGSYNDLEGDCRIGDYVRFHSNVHIGRGAIVGDFVWIFPNVVLTNDPIPPSGLQEGVVIEPGAVIATGAILLPGCVVGKGAFVAAMSRGEGHIPPASVIVGFDGQNVGGINKIRHIASGKQHPWMGHFSSYYPPDAQDRIQQLHTEIREELDKAARLESPTEGVSPGDAKELHGILPENIDLLNSILAIVNKILENRTKEKLPSLEPSMHLRYDIGFDSLDLAELTVRIESEYDIDIFEDGVIHTVSEILDKLNAKL